MENGDGPKLASLGAGLCLLPSPITMPFETSMAGSTGGRRVLLTCRALSGSVWLSARTFVFRMIPCTYLCLCSSAVCRQGSCCSRCCTEAGLARAQAYPLDLLRTRLAAQTTSSYYSGIGSSLATIVRDEGGIGLYRGLGATLLQVPPPPSRAVPPSAAPQALKECFGSR